jgi:tetratricopeptide (TPR) repeat protein
MSRAPCTTIAAGAPGLAAGWPVLAVAAILILAALGAYSNSFKVPFLLDDSSSISDNSSIRQLGRIGDVLSPPSTGTTAARSLLNLSFALNYAVRGLSVPGYHAVNLLIHICAGLALLGIVRRTLLSPGLRHRYGEAALPLAAFAALLWTLHPLQTEAVTYISQRAESLMGLFYLLTLYCFIRADVRRDRRTPPSTPDAAGFGRFDGLTAGDPALQKSAPGGSNRWLCLSVLVCFCGMATKQIMVTAPVIVLLYDRAFVSGSFRAALANRRWYYVSLGATWLLLGFLLHHSSLATVGVGFHGEVSWPTYALTELRVVTGYLKLAFWPHPLVFDYGTEILATDPLTVAPYALILITVLVGVVIVWCKSSMAGFLGAWSFLILAPSSSVVPIVKQPMAESRMYLPLAAVVVLLTLWSYALGRRNAYVALGIVAVGLGALTFHRNYRYRSELSIWEDTVTRLPSSSRGHCNLGRALARIPGRLAGAIAHYEEALRLRPDLAEVHNNLAIVLAKTPGRLPDAVAHYEEALRLRPDFAEAHDNLANALVKMSGRLADAIAHYEEALRLKPNFAEAHMNLAIALAKMPGRLPGAIAHYEEALRLQPDYFEAHNNLANVLAEMPGRLADAIAHYEEALRLKPDYFEAHNNLANALAKIPGRLADAIAHYEDALRLKPDLAEIHCNFANELAKMPGRLPEAIAHYEEALRLKPDFVQAHGSLAAAYAATGRWEAAIGQLEIAARLDPASTAIRDNLEKLKAPRKQ